MRIHPTTRGPPVSLHSVCTREHCQAFMHVHFLIVSLTWEISPEHPFPPDKPSFFQPALSGSASFRKPSLIASSLSFLALASALAPVHCIVPVFSHIITPGGPAPGRWGARVAVLGGYPLG